ncbi:uncharacterized protein ACRADG_010281 [Cochliomyia hominivorax]
MADCELFCENIELNDFVELSDSKRLQEVIDLLNDKSIMLNSSFWTLTNRLQNKEFNSKCLKFIRLKPFFTTDDCSSSMGCICKKHIIGGSIRYKNGSVLEINNWHVQYYCNPQIKIHDEILEYCLIYFDRRNYFTMDDNDSDDNFSGYSTTTELYRQEQKYRPINEQYRHDSSYYSTTTELYRRTAESYRREFLTDEDIFSGYDNTTELYI